MLVMLTWCRVTSDIATVTPEQPELVPLLTRCHHCDQVPMCHTAAGQLLSPPANFIMDRRVQHRLSYFDTSLSSTLSSESSTSSVCSCNKTSKEFWKQYKRGHKLNSIWRNVKSLFSRQNKRNNSCCQLERSRNIQQFYEELYLRENRSHILDHSTSSCDISIYSTIDEDLYYVPYK